MAQSLSGSVIRAWPYLLPSHLYTGIHSSIVLYFTVEFTLGALEMHLKCVQIDRTGKEMYIFFTLSV